MASKSDRASIIAIVGETGSGKTALSLELARRFNGEIVAADSRTIYAGLDIATAKPTEYERSVIPHHLIDVISPERSFSAADFKQSAKTAIEDINQRGKNAILVGGTGLYVDATLYDFTFRPKADEQSRELLNGMDVETLQKRVRELGLPLPENEKNPRHLIRAIETLGAQSGRSPLPDTVLLLGLRRDPAELRERLRARVEVMIEQGLLLEIEQAASKYGWDAPGLQAPAFRAFRPYFTQNTDLEEAKERFIQLDTQLAKRQRTWFRRNQDILWISELAESVELVTSFLNK